MSVEEVSGCVCPVTALDFTWAQNRERASRTGSGCALLSVFV